MNPEGYGALSDELKPSFYSVITGDKQLTVAQSFIFIKCSQFELSFREYLIRTKCSATCNLHFLLVSL